MAADDGKVGRGGVAVGRQAGGEVYVEKHQLAGVQVVEQGGPPSSRAVISSGGKPRGVVGVEVAHYDDVMVRLLEEEAEVGLVGRRAGGSGGDVEVEQL